MIPSYAGRMLLNGWSFEQVSKKHKEKIRKTIDASKRRTKRIRALEIVLKHFDLNNLFISIESLILQELVKLDIVPKKGKLQVKEFTEEEITNKLQQDIEEAGLTPEDFVKELYEVEFYKANRKETASAEVKLFLATLNYSHLGKTKKERQKVLKHLELAEEYLFSHLRHFEIKDNE